MSRPGVTYTDVARAANEILEEGELPTIERVRIKLATGSYSTLSVLLKEWKTKYALQQQYALNQQLPDELVTAVQKVWEVVSDKTEEQLNHLRQNAANTQQALEQEIRCQKDITANHEAKLAQLTEQHRLLNTDKTALEQSLQTQQLHYTELNAKYQSLENQLLEKQARIDEITRLNRQVQTNLEHYREASREQRLIEQQQHEKSRQMLEQKNHQLQESWMNVLTENTRFKTEYEQLALQHADSKNKTESLENKLTQQSESLTETRCLLTEKDKHLTEVYQQLTKSQEKIEALQNKQLAYEKQVAALTEKTTGQEQQIKELTAQNQLLSHDKWLLEQEKTKLLAELKKLTQEVMPRKTRSTT